MVNTDRLRVMTKLAAYDKKQSKQDLKLAHYYRSDYLRLQILKTIVALTVGYLILLIMVAVYHMDYLIAEAVTLDYKALFLYVIGIYALLLVIYIVGALILYSFRYAATRKKLAAYYENLKTLRRLYEEAGQPQPGDDNRYREAQR